jgi:uncharacterized protein (TIGR02145 family)
MNKSVFFLLFYIALAVQAGAQQIETGSTKQPFICGDTLKDTRDGKGYATVLIGSQCWMKENLNTGIRIRGSIGQTNNGIPEKYCYDNLEENCNIYGGLYQWNEVMQYASSQKGQGICPGGWHIPADEEWEVLVAFLGGDIKAGHEMKESGVAHYQSPNVGANNKSGFSSLPGGFSYATGSCFFDKINRVGYFWSSTPENDTDVWMRTLGNAIEKVGRHLNYKSTGISVRCIENQ